MSVVIDARPGEVWRAVEDIGSHTTWMADAEAIRFTSAQQAGVGTTFDCDTKIGPFRVTDRMAVTQWTPGKVMGVEHRGLVGGTGRFTLKRARKGRTRFTWEERLRFPWWFGGPVGAFVAKPVLAAVWRGNLRRLQALVEGGSPSGDE